MERLFGDDLAPTDQKQTHANTPLQTDQLPVVTERCCRQNAPDGLLVRQTDASHLTFHHAMEVMNVQILVAFSLGMPKHGQLDALNLIQWHTADSPLHGQRSARLVETVLATQRQVHRGLRFGGKPGGWTTTGKLRQNDGHGRDSPMITIFQRIAL